jgi:hypothetical protein
MENNRIDAPVVEPDFRNFSDDNRGLAVYPQSAQGDGVETRDVVLSRRGG